ncbi:unnamed protein product [Pelagomonas calceolata]|uniref:Uncharacterized protein n=1 Tax=Pelagomonas calceolata TaxID=35677 RepID=A0A8J2X323_9STRA|nr:unnamed protein product [Pelagomonas calceolata]
MNVDALEAMYAAIEAAYALKYGDITAVRERLHIDQADPLAGIVRLLREDCGVDSWHQLLSTHLECVLAWSPDQIEEFIQGINGLGNVYEVLADGLVKATNALEARFGRDRAIENYEFNTWKRAELKKKREELGVKNWLYLWDVLDRQLESYRVKRMPERPALPRVFCWGPLEDVDAELAAIDQALWRGHNFIEQARRDAADAVDAGFVRYLVAALRVPLAVTRVSWARAERDSYCESYDNFESYRRLVLERPSRDADGVPLLSRSEIDRVLPAIFGVDIVWAALPTDGPRRERQARAILVAEVLYEARRKQLVAHAAASGREVV